MERDRVHSESGEMDCKTNINERAPMKDYRTHRNEYGQLSYGVEEGKPEFQNGVWMRRVDFFKHILVQEGVVMDDAVEGRVMVYGSRKMLVHSEWEQALPDEPCAVCMETSIHEAWTQTRCKHTFHTVCLLKWLRVKSSCPLCRTGLGPQQEDESSGTESEEIAYWMAPNLVDLTRRNVARMRERRLERRAVESDSESEEVVGTPTMRQRRDSLAWQRERNERHQRDRARTLRRARDPRLVERFH